MRVAVITAGTLPVPAVRGGAVERLLENLVRANERYHQMDLTVISVYDPEAFAQAASYQHTHFFFVRENRFVATLDRLIYRLSSRFEHSRGVASYRHLFRRLLLLRYATRMLSENNFDKVVLENSATLFRILKARKNNLKYAGRYYFHIHNAVTGSYGCTTIMQKTKILAVSEYIMHSLPEFMKIIPNTDRHVVLNGIDIGHFHYQFIHEEKFALQRKLQLNAEDLVLLYVGRITPEKGIKELLLAFSQIKIPNIKLLIVGSSFFDSDIHSPFEKELRQLADTVRDRVRFTGYIPYSKLTKYYALADVAVLPSTWHEPAGLTMVEAQASGLPLITTDAGGIPEYIVRAGAMVLDSTNDLVSQLIDAISILVTNHDKRAMMSGYAEQVNKRFSLKNYYDQFLQQITDGGDVSGV
ncbi:MAG: glycosyltransferase family 4 protein [Sporolactobacillus sp.]